MAKYIDADKINAELMDEYHGMISDESMKIYKIMQMLDNAPAADVQEVKHANWVHLGGDEWCCSCCGFGKHTEGYWEKPTAKYCEKCGAEINGVEQ